MWFSRLLRFVILIVATALAQLRPQEVHAQLTWLAETEPAKNVSRLIVDVGRKFGALANDVSNMAGRAFETSTKAPSIGSQPTSAQAMSPAVAAPLPAAPQDPPNLVAEEKVQTTPADFLPMKLLPGADQLGRTFPLAESLRPQNLSGVVNTSITYSRSEIVEPGLESVFNEFTLNLEPILRTEAMGGLVLRSEARVAWMDNSGLDSALDESSLRFQRGATTLTHDFKESALRLTLGDIFSRPQNFQTTQRLLGLQLGTNYQAIHPYRTVFPSGRQSFQIERPARVQVYADGVLVAQQLLQPGQFDIEQFSTRYGTRDIELDIRDDTGGSTRVAFPTMSNMPRLADGVLNYGISAGAISGFDADGPDYQFEEFASSGFLDYGATANLTLGADFQIEPSIFTFGLRSVLATDAGSVQLRGSASVDGEESDVALGFQYTTPPSEQVPAVSVDLKYYGENYPSLREYRSSGASSFIFPGGDPKYEITASASESLSERLRVSVGGNWTKRHQVEPAELVLYPEERWSAFLSTQYKVTKNVRAGLSVSANSYRIGQDPSYGALVTLTRTLGDDHEAEVAYETRRKSSAVSVRSDPFKSVDRTAWQVRAEQAVEPTDVVSFSGEFDHTSNRFNAFGLAFQDHRPDADMTTRDAFFQLDTALAFAEGTIAVGRPVRQRGFAIVKAPHKADGGPVYVDDWGDGEYRAKTSFFGPALVSDILPYTNSKVELSQRSSNDARNAEATIAAISAEILAQPLVYTFPYAGVVIDIDAPDAAIQAELEIASLK